MLLQAKSSTVQLARDALSDRDHEPGGPRKMVISPNSTSSRASS
jgi:hypothetical protein